MKRTKTKDTINVLTGFEGTLSSGRLVEKIQRIPRKYKNCNKKGERMGQPYETVSYKGKQYVCFGLSSVYGELAGYCINID